MQRVSLMGFRVDISTLTLNDLAEDARREGSGEAVCSETMNMINRGYWSYLTVCEAISKFWGIQKVFRDSSLEALGVNLR